MAEQTKSETEDLRDQLRAAIKARAMVYYQVYVEIAEEFGSEKAKEILKRAIYTRGVAAGKQFRPYAPNDLAGLKEAFLHFVPDHGGMFEPEVVRCDASGLDLHMHRCPLKDAYHEAGLSDDMIATMCEIAGVVDNGVFDSAGFEMTGETWTPGASGCCTLHVRPGTPG